MQTRERKSMESLTSAAPVPVLERAGQAGARRSLLRREPGMAPADRPDAAWGARRDAIVAQATAVLLEATRAPADALPHGPDEAIGRFAAPPFDLFVQMQVADALLDAGIEPQHACFTSTIEAIVRHGRHGDGGHLRTDDWSRADTLAELAQILLLFARLGRHDLIAAQCEPPLAVLLAYAEADGVIPDWILPEAGSAKAVETVAALVYALARWDARRFLGMVVAGARWVACHQQPDGSWASAMGPDPYHGTWQALRLLGAVMPNHPAVMRGVAFLHAQRRPLGGWGAEGTDPLATALALLGLVASRVALPDGAAENALAVLAPSAAGWSAQPFLRHGRVRDTPPALIDHGSPLLTALFALKAAHALPVP